MSDLSTHLASKGVILGRKNDMVSLFPLEQSPFVSEQDALRALYPQAEAGDLLLRRAFAAIYKHNPRDIHLILSEAADRPASSQLSQHIAAHDVVLLGRAVREWEEQRYDDPRFPTPTLTEIAQNFLGDTDIPPKESLILESEIIAHVQDVFADRGLPRTAFTHQDLADIADMSFDDLKVMSAPYLADAVHDDVDHALRINAVEPGAEVVLRTTSGEDIVVCVKILHQKNRSTMLAGRVCEGEKFGEPIVFSKGQIVDFAMTSPLMPEEDTPVPVV